MKETATQLKLVTVDNSETNDKRKVHTALSTLRSRNKRNSVLLNTLKFDWPVADEILRKFIIHFSGIGTKNGNEQVILQIIQNALDTYSELVYFTKAEKYKDVNRIYGFVERLITETEKHLNVKFVDAEGRSWSIMSSEKFSDWIKANEKQNEVKQVEKGSLTNIREYLYNFISNDGFKQIMRTAHYEQALVDGRMAVSL